MSDIAKIRELYRDIKREAKQQGLSNYQSEKLRSLFIRKIQDGYSVNDAYTYVKRLMQLLTKPIHIQLLEKVKAKPNSVFVRHNNVYIIKTKDVVNVVVLKRLVATFSRDLFIADEETFYNKYADILAALKKAVG